MDLIKRHLTSGVMESLKHFPVVGITGPRQCGKSTLVRFLLEVKKESVHLDLERPSDLRKLDEAEWFFHSQKGKIICLDEVQRKPEIFPLIRSVADEWRSNGNFIILGSATSGLLRQSSESLAGRISYKRLTPFLWREIRKNCTMEYYISRGGFPSSFLADKDHISFEWRENFISAFIERDLMQWTGSSPVAVRRLWHMLAHLNGQTINYSSVGNSLGISNSSVKNYLDILQSTYMIDIVPPNIANFGKRIIKSPKVYINDSGILSTLLGLQGFNELAGHPVFGSVWEGVVLANLRGHFPEADIHFYRTSHGAELDFLLFIRNKLFVIECKASLSPSLTRGSYTAIEDIKASNTFIVAPVQKGYAMNKNIDVVSLGELIERIEEQV